MLLQAAYILSPVIIPRVILAVLPVGNDVHPLVTSEHAGAAVTIETILIVTTDGN